MARRNANNGWIPWLLLAIVVVGGWMAWPRQQALPTPAGSETTYPTPREVAAPLPPVAVRHPVQNAEPPAQLPDFLPVEAHHTIALIRRGGPFPHRQDGSTFGNRENRLPRQTRGWYREYTVDTPGLSHRGARRIVTGGDPPREWYYTDDHYDSFRRFEVAGRLH